MNLTTQVLASGLAAGAVYGVVAIGHSIIYRLTGIVHFAFGDLVGLSIFATLLFAAGTAPITQTSVSWTRFAPALLGGLSVCIVAGVATYVVAVEPYLARGSTVGWVAATAAIAFAIRAALGAFFTRPSYVFPDPIPFRNLGSGGFVHVLGASFQVRTLFVVAVGAALALLAQWALERTRFGRGLQAIASDVESARIVGVPVEWLTAAAFGLAGAVAALAAVAAAPGAPFDVRGGTLLGVKGLVAALAVGFGSPWRAFVAGIGLGILEAAIGGFSIGGATLGPSYREVIPLALALLLLAVRPMRSALRAAE